MTFAKKLDTQKKFGGRETRTVSIKVPIDEYESIKAILNEFVDNFREDNPQRIEIIQDGIEEIISVNLDIKDYIKKEGSITKSKYTEIYDNHNSDLINGIITEFSIERKQPIKTLTEEENEKELRKRKEELRKKELRAKSKFKTGWEGFGIKRKDYLIIKELNQHYKGYKEKTNRAKKLWEACLGFYGDIAYERKTSYVAPKPYVAPQSYHKSLGMPEDRKKLNKSIRKAMKRK